MSQLVERGHKTHYEMEARHVSLRWESGRSFESEVLPDTQQHVEGAIEIAWSRRGGDVVVDGTDAVVAVVGEEACAAGWVGLCRLKRKKFEGACASIS